MTNAQKDEPCGWYGTIQQFLLCPKSEWQNALAAYHQMSVKSPADEGQKASWEHSFEILQKELKQLVQLKPDLRDYSILFDYEMPRSKGKRADIIILGASVFILAFKENAQIIRADIDAAGAFERDLKRHHPKSHTPDVVPILVLAKARDLIRRDGDVIILSPDHIADYFNVQAELEDGHLIDAYAWTGAR
jgi:hypothetical protein